MRTPDRGDLTDLLLVTLAPLGFPVGDAAAPEPDPDREFQAGWNGEPNAPGSVYVPYVVLTPQTATFSSGPMSDPQGDWRLPYSLSHFGVSRKQVESLSVRCRQVLEALRNNRPELGGVAYKIQQVEFGALGGVGRVDQTNPSTFGEVDSLTVWLAK